MTSSLVGSEMCIRDSYKTILLEEIIACMWINLILKTIYAFNGRINFYTCFFWIFWENLFKLLCCNWSTTASTSTLFRLCAINIRLAGFCLWRWNMPLDREKNFLPFKYVLFGFLWGLSVSIIIYISVGRLNTTENPWDNNLVGCTFLVRRRCQR